MQPFFSFFRCTTVLVSAVALVRAQYVNDAPSIIKRELEHLYLDAGAASLITAVQPCTKYTDPETGKAVSTKGRQSAAEWIRTAFHDFVTATITQTGGLDASIGFETTRDENVGVAFNDSLNRFSYYVSQRVSMSDMIALGVVLATGACGGPHVPFRGGRKDATQAGPTGVPKPEDSNQQILLDMSNANFNQDDTIALTACGHTLGGVHHSDFPQVVPSSAVTTSNTDGRQDFDTSVGAFDKTVLDQYLKGTGNKGGPLVTSKNATVRSDFRLYNSDGNATVKRLAQSSDYFKGQCAALFQRMIEVVPSGVQFTPYVDPTTSTNLQPFGVYLSIDWSGNMILTGNLRYIQVSGAGAAPATITITLIDRSGKTTTTTTKATASSADTGNGLWGPTKSYPFTLKFKASVGLSGIKASGKTFKFQDTMFVSIQQSSIKPTPPPFSLDDTVMGATAIYKANTTVAYLPASGKAAPNSLTALFAIPMPQSGTVSPKIDTSTSNTLKKIGTSGPYTLYSAVTTKPITAKQAYGSSVDVAVSGSNTPGVMFFKPFIPNA